MFEKYVHTLTLNRPHQGLKITSDAQVWISGCFQCRDANVAPQDLKASNLTPVSCQISWYPSNSSCEHIILLNGLKVGSCPPGVCQIRMNGLIPSTMYRCSVRVKEPRAVLEEKPVENWVDFKTLPKIGVPDPPSNVQCELGPQDGTLLVTWTPVKNQPKPPSRAAVIGYLIYADGRKITEIDSPTGDHVVLRCADLADDPPLFLTVKAKTREGAVSADSNVVRVPRIDGHGMPASMIDVAKMMSATSSLPRNVTIATTLAASAPTFQLLSSHAGQPSCPATSATGGLLMIQPQVDIARLQIQAFQLRKY
uniref:Fibronectin type-III domain-containing protein n=1 Tax=Romanomermis culicivorax TaxID=13658 RepID=A0A915JG51_ROMCU